MRKSVTGRAPVRVRVLSLFDGISCGRVALRRAGIPVSEYHACEIDKHAIQVSAANYPDIIRQGNVIGYSPTQVFDLVIGGSPCQGFSFAGKQLAFDDPRSQLFFEYVRILKECRKSNPNVKFLFENVRMKKAYLDVISSQLGVDPVCLNSALVSAQNRVRYYWCNWEVGPIRDRGILLKTIIETGVLDRDNSYSISTESLTGSQVVSHIKKRNTALAFTERRTEEAKRLRSKFMRDHGRDSCPRRAKELAARKDGKMNCLTATFSVKEHALIDETSRFRKVTPLECERLQTLPDNYTESISTPQRYKAIGNGWTVDIITHILKGLNDAQ